jgi:hypothetical protein
MLKNAHIRSMGAALMRAAAVSPLICREDKSATVGHDTAVWKECRERNRSQSRRQGLLGLSRGGERLSETVQECREARQLL